MSNFSETGSRPNDKMPKGKPLGHDEVAGAEDEVQSGDDSFGILDDEDEDNSSVMDRENQAGSGKANAEKFGGSDEARPVARRPAGCRGQERATGPNREGAGSVRKGTDGA
ncbi:hypothetical protein GCM10011390_44500 [Aureimonas endophytica]|uniref:Uncharacterized protein n=2 Tax=Aureimonas endophytica TaxID=2027858 RepID=A0A917EAX4_9HYPH|nr:hypothetical protein GCM10011390_44500 [Aureimonas endophytica]